MLTPTALMRTDAELGLATTPGSHYAKPNAAPHPPSIPVGLELWPPPETGVGSVTLSPTVRW